MGKIGLDNYEAYLLDYAEGHLAASLREEMQRFLEAHPEIASEVEGLDAVRLEAEPLAFPNPGSLYQAEAAILEETQEFLFLQAADGSLDQEAQKRLALWLKEHPDAGREYRAAMLTRLAPDEQIAFPDKKGLKKSIPLYRQPFFINASRLAAVFLLLLLSLTLIRFPGDDPLLAPGDMVLLLPDRASAPLLPPGDKVVDPLTKAEEEPQYTLPDERPHQALAVSRQADRAAETRPAAADPFYLKPVPANAVDQRIIPASQVPAWIAYRSTPYNKSAAIKSLIAAGPEPEKQGRVLNISWLLGRKGSTRTTPQNEGWITNPVFWDIADAGITTINALTDQRLTLERDVDDDGNTVSYALYSNGFEIARKRRFE